MRTHYQTHTATIKNAKDEIWLNINLLKFSNHGINEKISKIIDTYDIMIIYHKDKDNENCGRLALKLILELFMNLLVIIFVSVTISFITRSNIAQSLIIWTISNRCQKGLLKND